MIVERAHATGIGDVPVLVDHVQALGPSGISVVRDVAHVIDPKWHRVVKSLHEVIGDGNSLGQGLRLRVADVVFHVGLRLPFVGGVRFADVDGQEVGVVLVIVVDLDDVADLATEGRSSVAAEDDNQGPRADALSEPEVVRAVEGQKAHIGRSVSDVEFAAVHVGQGIAEHVEGIFGPAGHKRQAAECQDEQSDQASENPFPKFIQGARPLRVLFGR
jgi:hypothetical protein